MQDIYSTIKDQYGVDPKEGLNPTNLSPRAGKPLTSSSR